MARRMEENVYDDLTEARLDAPMTKIVVWDGVAYEFDVSEESNAKLNEHMQDFLGMGTQVEGDDLNVIVSGGIGGSKWDGEEQQATEAPDQPRSTRRALTDDQVREIRKEYNSAGSRPATALAEAYGVSLPTIYSVASGRSYKDVK